MARMFWIVLDHRRRGFQRWWFALPELMTVFPESQRRLAGDDQAERFEGPVNHDRGLDQPAEFVIDAATSGENGRETRSSNCDGFARGKSFMRLKLRVTSKMH